MAFNSTMLETKQQKKHVQNKTQILIFPSQKKGSFPNQLDQTYKIHVTFVYLPA